MVYQTKIPQNYRHTSLSSRKASEMCVQCPCQRLTQTAVFKIKSMKSLDKNA